MFKCSASGGLVTRLWVSIEKLLKKANLGKKVSDLHLLGMFFDRWYYFLKISLVVTVPSNTNIIFFSCWPRCSWVYKMTLWDFSWSLKYKAIDESKRKFPQCFWAGTEIWSFDYFQSELIYFFNLCTVTYLQTFFLCVWAGYFFLWFKA